MLILYEKIAFKLDPKGTMLLCLRKSVGTKTRGLKFIFIYLINDTMGNKITRLLYIHSYHTLLSKHLGYTQILLCTSCKRFIWTWVIGST